LTPGGPNGLDGNEASARAQKAAGYKEVAAGTKNGKWVDHVLTELRRDDWEKANSV
jgi:RimJ/RimL family protein N-acetyltransferase